MNPTEERIVMYNDEAAYKKAVAQEKAMNRAVKSLTDILKSVTKEDIDINYKKFLDNPIKYMVSTYWKVWGKKFNPPGSDKERVFFNKTGVEASHILTLTSRFKENKRLLGPNGPYISQTIVSTLKKESFDVIVDPMKIPAYKKALKFTEAIEEFNKDFEDFKFGPYFHISRYTNHMIRIDGKPNYDMFKLKK